MIGVAFRSRGFVIKRLPLVWLQSFIESVIVAKAYGVVGCYVVVFRLRGLFVAVVVARDVSVV